MGVKSPCYGCTERKVGCHSNCDTYLDFQQKVKEQNAKRDMINAYRNGYVIEKKARLDKMMNNKRGK